MGEELIESEGGIQVQDNEAAAMVSFRVMGVLFMNPNGVCFDASDDTARNQNDYD